MRHSERTKGGIFVIKILHSPFFLLAPPSLSLYFPHLFSLLGPPPCGSFQHIVIPSCQRLNRKKLEQFGGGGSPGGGMSVFVTKQLVLFIDIGFELSLSRSYWHWKNFLVSGKKCSDWFGNNSRLQNCRRPPNFVRNNFNSWDEVKYSNCHLKFASSSIDIYWSSIFFQQLSISDWKSCQIVFSTEIKSTYVVKSRIETGGGGENTRGREGGKCQGGRDMHCAQE